MHGLTVLTTSCITEHLFLFTLTQIHISNEINLHKYIHCVGLLVTVSVSMLTLSVSCLHTQCPSAHTALCKSVARYGPIVYFQQA